MVRVSFSDSSPVLPAGEDMLPCSVHYLKGGDSQPDPFDLRCYRTVVYKDLWDGIDMRLFFLDGKLKYEFVVPPWNDPSRIRLGYEGVESLTIEPSSQALEIRTACVTLVDERPSASTVDDNKREGLDCAFSLTDGPTVGFTLSPRFNGRTVVIDPGVNFFSFLGGTDYDYGNGLAVDGLGNVYLAGQTESADFPTTAGAFDPSPDGMDGFVAKINASSSTIQFVTFIGGNQADECRDIALDGKGRIIVMGRTRSEDFPITPGALNQSSRTQNIFVSSLSPDGTSLVYSCVVGGSQWDYGQALAVDLLGSAYVAGYTGSRDFPLTNGSFCTVWQGGIDGFLFKVDDRGAELCYSTLLGGSSDDNYGDRIDLFVDDSSCVYIAGQTTSADFPVTPGAYDSDLDGGDDVYCAKVNANGTDLEFSTFLGGSGDDNANALWIGDDGKVFITGITFSQDFPTSPNAHDRTLNGGTDGFITVLDANGSSLMASTYLGGSSYDSSLGLVVDDEGCPFVCGYTRSLDFPVSDGCFDASHNGGMDAFVTKMTGDLTSIETSTFIGGTAGDWAMDIRYESNGTVLIVGHTDSEDFPTTMEAPWPVNSGGEDAFICRFRPEFLDGQDPGAPRNVHGRPGDRSASVYWDPPDDDGNLPILGYCLYEGPSGSDLSMARRLDSLPHNITMEPLQAGKPIYCAVSAFNSRGEGPLSSIVTITPTGQPTEPTGFRAEPGFGRVNLSWDPPVDAGDLYIMGYWIYRGEVAGAMDRIASLDADARGYVDEPLEIGKDYYYSVCAFNARGNGTFSRTLRATPSGPPGVPRDFEVIAGDGMVTLEWSPPETDGGKPVLGYHIYRGGDMDSMVLYETVLTFLAYVDRDVTNGLEYYYAVQPFNLYGDGVRTPPELAVPRGTPRDPPSVTVAIGDSVVSIEWTAPTDDGGARITGYRIYRGETREAIALLFTVGNTTRWNDLGVSNGVTYYYRVSSFNVVGEGPLSDVVSGTPMRLPGAPRDLAAAQEGGAVRLDWLSPEDWGGASGLSYQVLRGELVDALTLLCDVGAAQDFVDNDVQGGLTYFYQVRASNPMGWGEPSETVRVRILRPPGPPVNLQVVPGNHSVELTWTAPGDDGGAGITGYIILRGEFPTGLVQVSTVQNATEYLDEGLENGNRYYYAVRAFNHFGTGIESDTVNGTPRDVPGPPLDLTVRVKDLTVSLSWTEPEAHGSVILGYVVLRSAGGRFDTIAFVEGALRYDDKDVERGIEYRYRVVARSDVGDGGPSGEVRAKIPKDEEISISLIYLVIILLIAMSIPFALYCMRRGQLPDE